ncbi:MAG: hypothetical protein RSD07_07150 [Angelakisella sp.]
MDDKIKIRIDTKMDVGATAGFSRLIEMIRQMTHTAEAATKGQTALAKATAAAGAAAKGALASFDDLNVLEKKSSTGSGSGSKPGKLPKPENPDDGTAQLTFLEQLAKALEPLTETLFAGLGWGYQNVLLPLSQWTQNEALPSFLAMVGTAAQLLCSALDVLKPVAIWLWESFLQPLGQWTGEMAILAIEALSRAFEGLSLWIEENRAKLTGLWEAVEPLLTQVSEFVQGIFDGIREYAALWAEGFTELLTGALDLWLGILTGSWELAWQGIQSIFETQKTLLLYGLGLLWQSIKDGFGRCLEVVKLLWAPIGEWFMQNVMTPLDKNFGWLWDGVVLGAKIAWQMVLGVWEPLSAWFMEKVVTPVSSFVQKMWDDILGYFIGGLGHLRSAITDYINFTLDMFQSGANMIIDLFNGIISALNKISVQIPDWVPEYGGRSFGISIPQIPQVTIPRLATGAVIPPNAQFAAILGDQRAGRNLEAPEGLIRDIVREESSEREIVIRFEGSMAQLARVLAPALEQENSRQGTRLILGGA